jgi:hypothetical protein
MPSVTQTTWIVVIPFKIIVTNMWLVVNQNVCHENVTLSCRDKKNSIVCKISADHASLPLSAPSDNLVSWKFPSRSDHGPLSTWAAQHVFLVTTFLNFVLMLTTSLLFFCLSSDLLSSLFWSMHIKTPWPFWKSYHCLKYALIEHTVVSLYKAEHNIMHQIPINEFENLVRHFVNIIKVANSAFFLFFLFETF